MPPVGQNLACGSGPASDLVRRAARRPAPGRTSSPAPRAPAAPPPPRSWTPPAGTAPGRLHGIEQYVGPAGADSRKRAPAATHSVTCVGVMTVPAPTTAPGTPSAIARMASSAHGVRRVTSMRGQPTRDECRGQGHGVRDLVHRDNGTAGGEIRRRRRREPRAAVSSWAHRALAAQHAQRALHMLQRPLLRCTGPLQCTSCGSSAPRSPAHPAPRPSPPARAPAPPPRTPGPARSPPAPPDRRARPRPPADSVRSAPSSPC